LTFEIDFFLENSIFSYMCTNYKQYSLNEDKYKLNFIRIIWLINFAFILNNNLKKKLYVFYELQVMHLSTVR